MKDRSLFRLFIYPEIQLKILAVIFFAGLLGLIIFGAFIYMQNQIIFQLAQKTGHTQQITKHLWTYGLASGVIYLLGLTALLFFGLLVSHRIVGPLKRIKRELDEMKEKREVKLCLVRDKDYLLPFFKKLNQVLIHLTWEGN